MSKRNDHQLLIKAKERFNNDPLVATKISKITSFLNSSLFISSPIISIDQAAIFLDLSKNGNIDGSPIKSLFSGCISTSIGLPSFFTHSLLLEGF